MYYIFYYCYSLELLLTSVPEISLNFLKRCPAENKERGSRRRQKKGRCFQYQFEVGILRMLYISNTTKTVIVWSVVIVLIILINITYILYHLYMKKKTEFSNRLLNVLYSHVATYIQIGSFVNFLLILHSLGLFGFRNKSVVMVLLMLRYVQLLIVFFYIVAISLSNTLHTFKMLLYLHLSCSYYGSIYIFVAILISRYLKIYLFKSSLLNIFIMLLA